MNLHSDQKVFTEAIQAASDHFKILPVFIEKDYWITLVLNRLAESGYTNSVVFKGGTSLSKGYKLINRFSEDVDIAIINASGMTGNQLKTLIRNVEKTISVDLKEIDTPGVTSKGSQFRKTVFTSPVIGNFKMSQGISDKLIIEVNSFANPYPYVNLEIKCLISEFLTSTGKQELIKEYGLKPFSLNILDKRHTLIEKIVSLIRFSFSDNPTESIAEKIRHFYDIYYLVNDTECRTYLDSPDFIKDITEVIKHDRKSFDEPPGWGQKPINQSPLLNNFDTIWNSVKAIYTKELSSLAFSEIPNEKDVSESFKKVINKLNSITI